MRVDVTEQRPAQIVQGFALGNGVADRGAIDGDRIAVANHQGVAQDHQVDLGGAAGLCRHGVGDFQGGVVVVIVGVAVIGQHGDGEGATRGHRLGRVSDRHRCIVGTRHQHIDGRCGGTAVAVGDGVGDGVGTQLALGKGDEIGDQARIITECAAGDAGAGDGGPRRRGGRGDGQRRRSIVAVRIRIVGQHVDGHGALADRRRDHVGVGDGGVVGASDGHRYRRRRIFALAVGDGVGEAVGLRRINRQIVKGQGVRRIGDGAVGIQ